MNRKKGKERFAENLRYWMDARGLDTVTLAKKTEQLGFRVDPSLSSRWLRRHPKGALPMAIPLVVTARALRVTVEELIEWTGKNRKGTQ